MFTIIEDSVSNSKLAEIIAAEWVHEFYYKSIIIINDNKWCLKYYLTCRQTILFCVYITYVPTCKQ